MVELDSGGGRSYLAWMLEPEGGAPATGNSLTPGHYACSAGAAAYTRSVRIEGIGRGGKAREETLEIRLWHRLNVGLQLLVQRLAKPQVTACHAGAGIVDQGLQVRACSSFGQQGVDLCRYELAP